MDVEQTPWFGALRIDLDTYFKLLLEFNKPPGRDGPERMAQCSGSVFSINGQRLQAETTRSVRRAVLRLSRPRRGIHFTNMNVGAKIGSWILFHLISQVSSAQTAQALVTEATRMLPCRMNSLKKKMGTPWTRIEASHLPELCVSATHTPHKRRRPCPSSAECTFDLSSWHLGLGSAGQLRDDWP